MAAPSTYERVGEMVAAVRPHLASAPEVGIVLGSGLAEVAEAAAASARLPYHAVPHLAPTAVAGHPGELAFAELAGVSVALLCGRVHAYEGHPPETVGMGMRLLAGLGAHTVVLTNAAGGLTRASRPGDLMAIVDHLNLTGCNPLIGPHDPRLGPRFLDMTRAYCPRLLAAWRRAAVEAGLPLQQGVYAGVLGPSYETPSEVEHFARLGAQAVGMSTVLETLVARHAGLRVAGLSVITNCAAGLGGGDLCHDDVTEVGRGAQARVLRLLRHFLPLVGSPPPAGPAPASGA